MVCVYVYVQYVDGLQTLYMSWLNLMATNNKANIQSQPVYSIWPVHVYYLLMNIV